MIVEDGNPLHFVECKKKSGRDISRPPNYLKTRFPSVRATQVSFEDNIDLITREGIRICSAHLFFRSLCKDRKTISNLLRVRWSKLDVRCLFLALDG